MAVKQPSTAANYIHALVTGPPGIGKTTLIKRVCSVVEERGEGVNIRGFYTEEVRGGGRGGGGGGGGGRGGRGGGRGRIGFDVVTMDGQRGILSRVPSSPVQPLSRASARERKPVFVGKYQVDITSFEQTALPSLNLSGKEQSKLSARSSGGGEQSKLSTTAAKSSGGGLECPSYQKDTRLSPDNGRGSSTKQEEQLHGGVGGRGAVRSLLVIDEVGKMELYSRRFVDAVGSLFQRRDVVLLATIPVAKQKSHWLVEELRHRTDCLLFEVSEQNRDSLVQDVSKFILQRLATM